MKKIWMKIALVAAILVSLVWAVPGQTETVTVGNALTERAYLDPNFGYNIYTDIAVVDYTNTIPRNGNVTGFQYFAHNTNPFYFFLIDDSFIIKWVSEKIVPSGTGVMAYDLTTRPVPVQSGWMIGAYFISEGTIPFDYDELGRSGSVLCLYNSPLPAVDSYFAYNDISNRSYSLAATVVPVSSQPGETVDVTVVKYLDGAHANSVSAGGNPFPLLTSWGDPNNSTIGGTDYFYLEPDGYNTLIPYEAKSPVMPVGSFYTVAEDTTQDAVRTSCDDHFPFSRLVGYTTGASLDEAKIAALTPGAPSLTNILSNRYVIVWNETCQYAKVTVVKYLDGRHADTTSAQSKSFPMQESYGSGFIPFALGPAGVNTGNPYEAQSRTMARGASYSVSEDTGTSAVGTTCANGQFSRLLGYTTGNSITAAETAKRTTTAPALTNITGNQYVIVWNETCPAIPPDDDDCDHDDNGHHYGNDKGDNHKTKEKCTHKDNGHHYGNDKGDNHTSPKK